MFPLTALLSQVTGLTCRAWVKCGPSANKAPAYICTVRKKKKHASRTLPFMTFCP